MLTLTGLWLALWTPAGVIAGEECDREIYGHLARADRPAWVMVFSLDEHGELVLETRGRTGVYVSRELPVVEECRMARCDREGGARGFSIMVTSNRPFALPHGFARHQVFRVTPHAPWRNEHTRRLCQLLGVPVGSVRVTVHSWSRLEAPGCGHAVCARSCTHAGWPWVGLAKGDRVYVDGGFVGCGVSALFAVSAGPHRVTVVTERGRKDTRWVSFPAARTKAGRVDRVVCR
jgi:hypothetical protein